MATILRRISGVDSTGKRVREEFPESKPREAQEFAQGLTAVRTTYQARVRIGGRQASQTFQRKIDAERWARKQETEGDEGKAIDPRHSKLTVAEFGTAWLAGRADLAETTAALYDYYLNNFIIPALGDIRLADLTTGRIRTWHANIAKEHPSTAAKCYRFLRRMMNAAVEEKRIRENPCKVPGADKEPDSERPSASLAEVQALMEAYPANLRLAVLLACWVQLRRGEMLGLRRRDIDVVNQELRVRNTQVMTMNRKQVTKGPKTDAGKRDLSIPDHIMPHLIAHLEHNVGKEPDARVFPCTPAVWRRSWERARKAIGRPDLHMHDLRGTGLTLAAIAGATTAELMYRAGHATPAMVMRYQRATKDRDKYLAGALSKLATAAS
jgi:integrase